MTSRTLIKTLGSGANIRQRPDSTRKNKRREKQRNKMRLQNKVALKIGKALSRCSKLSISSKQVRERKTAEKAKHLRNCNKASGFHGKTCHSQA